MLSIFVDIWILFGIYMFLTLLWSELPELNDWVSLVIMAFVSSTWPIIVVLMFVLIGWDRLKVRFMQP